MRGKPDLPLRQVRFFYGLHFETIYPIFTKPLGASLREHHPSTYPTGNIN